MEPEEQVYEYKSSVYEYKSINTNYNCVDTKRAEEFLALTVMVDIFIDLECWLQDTFQITARKINATRQDYFSLHHVAVKG